MNRNHRKSRDIGWTLVEIMITLIVAGVAITVASRLLAGSSAQSTAQQSTRSLEDAKYALVGYLRANLHLPAPHDGWLPGSLSSNLFGNRIRYFVAQALTEVPTDRFNPHGLMEPGGPNGLDLCRKIAQTRDADLLQLAQGPDAQQVAVVLEYSSSGQASSSSTQVAMPGTPEAARREQRGTYSRAIGIGELFAELQCPERIGRSAAAAKYVWAMQDMVDLAKSNTTLKEYDLDVGQAEAHASELGLAQLIMTMTLLTMDHVNTTDSLLSKLPKAPWGQLAFYNANFVATEASVAIALQHVQESVNQWPATQAAMKLAIDTAKAKQAIVEAAFADSRKELRAFQLLGLNK